MSPTQRGLVLPCNATAFSLKSYKVFVLNTYHLIVLISIPSKKPSPKSSIFYAGTKITYYLATTNDGLLYDMYEIFDIITPEDTAGYFMNAGYF